MNEGLIMIFLIVKNIIVLGVLKVFVHLIEKQGGLTKTESY